MISTIVSMKFLIFSFNSRNKKSNSQLFLIIKKIRISLKIPKSYHTLVNILWDKMLYLNYLKYYIVERKTVAEDIRKQHSSIALEDMCRIKVKKKSQDGKKKLITTNSKKYI